MVEDRLIAPIELRESQYPLNSLTSCLFISPIDRAMSVACDYDDNLVSSFPKVIGTLEKLQINWLTKEIAPKPTHALCCVAARKGESVLGTSTFQP